MASAENEIMEKMKKPWVQYVVIFIAIVLVANISSTLTLNRAGERAGEGVQPLKDELERVTARIAEVDAKTGGLLDLAEVKSNVETLQKAGESFNAKLNALVKAEEAKLETLTKELENQKAYVQELKNLLSEGTGK